MTARRVQAIFNGSEPHIVGDGFPVQTFVPQSGLDAEITPFLLLDYAGPHAFPPTDQPRGVDEHPHRGFETVTVIYQGEVEHRDSAGNSGRLGPGDVQWMTAASGLVHEEKHERAFAARGGTIEMVQLWVNLPRANKMVPPAYQDLRAADIPAIDVANGGGSVRVIAGSVDGRRGPARTFTPVGLFDVKLNAGARTEMPLVEGHNAAILVLRGRVTVDGKEIAAREMALLASSGDRLAIEAADASDLLVMSGEPIREPVARYGPFVMNTREELLQAVHDYQSGQMGHLT